MISPQPFSAAADFKLSITQALADQLAERLRPLRPAPLSENSFEQVENRPGITADHFDALYPINLNATVDLTPGVWRVEELLAEVKAQLPYNLRYERTSAAARHDYQAAVHVESPTPSARQIVKLVLGALPVGWQLTALPGYAILYQETIDYQTALGWWRSTTTGVVETTGPAHTAPPASDKPLFTEEPADDDDP